MVKALKVLLLLVLSCACVRAEDTGTTPVSSSTLDVPVTLAAKGEALSDIAAMLSAQTGLKLRATSEIADQKATVFVDKRPLRDLMTGIETVFGYRWSLVKEKDGQVYELWVTAKAKQARDAAVHGVWGKVWPSVDSMLRQVSQLSEESWDARNARLERLRDKKDRTPAESAQLGLLRSANIAGSLAQLYLTLSPDLIEALQSGCSVYFDTSTSESEWRVPQQIDTRLTTDLCRMYKWPDRPARGYNIKLFLGMSGDQLGLSAECTTFVTGKDGSEKPRAGIITSPCPDVVIGDLQPDSPQPALPMAPDDGTLSKQLAFTAKDLADEADLYGQTDASSPIYANRSDVLALLHRKTGAQVISDHYSGWRVYLAKQTQTVSRLLDHIGDGVDPQGRPAWGWDGKYLYLREWFPYELDAAETPNRLLRQWRAGLIKRQCWDLEDAGGVVSIMSGVQSALNEQPLFLTTNRDWVLKKRGVDYSKAIIDIDFPAMMPLRFYGHLSDAQKRRVLADGLAVSSLSTSQLDYLAKCLETTLPDFGRAPTMLRRVGIYRSGLRVDRPDPGFPAPVSVRIEKRPSQTYALCVPCKGSPIAEWHKVTAHSTEDALKQIRSQYPDLLKQAGVVGQDMGYVLVMVFADGSTKEFPVPLCEPVTVRGQ